MDIPRLRLISQNIEKPKFKRVKEIVGWMGAMQAQDYNMVKWAAGLRLKKSTEKIFEDAINEGEIIRTHLMRPTWHLVSSDDIYWMLDLTSARIKSAMKFRDKELGLTPAVFRKSNKVIEKALAGGKHLSREELIAEIQKAKIATDNNRASHLFLRAELEGIICSGKSLGSKHTYALLEERVPGKNKLNKEEALRMLAVKYFTSHCPATVEDFSWWSGLTLTDSRKAAEMIKPVFKTVKINDKIYMIPESYTFPVFKSDNVHVLPAYDEFIISYRDREEFFGYNVRRRSVSSNGIFRPVIVLNGQIAGNWKRTFKKGEVLIEKEILTELNKTQKYLVDSAFKKYAVFLNKNLRIL